MIRVRQTTGTDLFVVLPDDAGTIEAHHTGSGPDTWQWDICCGLCTETTTVKGGFARLTTELAMLRHADRHVELGPGPVGWDR